MRLTNSGPRQMASAVQGMSITLTYVEAAFAFLTNLHSDQETDQYGFEAVCYLCGQGVAYGLKRDGDIVEDLITRLNEEAQQEDAS